MSRPTVKLGLEPLFAPESIAIMGTPSGLSAIGVRTQNFLQNFTGQVTIVDRFMKTEAGEVARGIDQVIISEPQEHVEAAILAAADADARSIVLYSGGFAEMGPEGAQAQLRLLEICKSKGVRLLGPNSAGIVSVKDNMFSTYSHSIEYFRPAPGNIAFVTQSGAVGTFALCKGVELGLGFSRFVATGNEADVDIAECISWLADDSQTAVILVYLESVEDGDALLKALRKANAAGKPVIFLKGGASETGAAAAASHTGKLAGSDTVYSAAFSSTGACRVTTIEEMLDVAYFCSCSVMPTDQNMTILTGSGGIGVMMADIASQAKLQLPTLSAAVGKKIRDLIPEAGILNPVDTTGQILNDFSLLSKVLNVILADENSGTLALFTATIGLDDKLARQLEKALASARHDHPDKVITICTIASPEFRNILESNKIPVFAEPSRLVKAVGLAAGIKTSMHEPSANSSATPAAAQELPPLPWSETVARDLLSRHGISFPPVRTATTAEQAESTAKSMGVSVALKVISPDIAHKWDVGGVELGVSPEDARAVFARMISNVKSNMPTARIDGVTVSPMIEDGIETLIGARIDPIFGPTVLFGMGGIHAEIIDDVAVQLAPVDRAQALNMIDSIRGAALLKGARGRKTMDIETLADTLVRISEISVIYQNEIDSIEINPFMALEDGGQALDALIVAKSSNKSTE